LEMQNVLSGDEFESLEVLWVSWGPH